MRTDGLTEDDRTCPANWHDTLFCGLPLTVGMTAGTVVARAFQKNSSRALLTTFVNPGAIHIVRRNPHYGSMLKAFDIILPDGVGIVWGWRATHRSSLTRLSFDTTSLALPVLRKAREEKRRVMLIGGRPGVADDAADKLAKALPGLQFCRSHHGFDETAAYESHVRKEQPDVVICGMGAPHQEALLLALRECGALAGPAFTCGGYLDQLHGGLRYYPKLVDSLNLRWLYRLFREPRRLWRRYLLEYPEYGIALLRELQLGSSTHRYDIGGRA